MLKNIDLTLKMGNDEYEKLLPGKQLEMIHLQQRLRERQLPVIIMYEGWDAAGKGGNILRLTEKLDPRGYRVYPIGPPTEVESHHTYLWRFWINEPEKGQIVIFDRSWYGRVLVERVEKFTQEADWNRAYDEIDAFEEYLVGNGVILIKFFLHISKDEQKKRFDDRKSDPFKQYKITEDDWRNREKWDQYLEATEDMLKRTSLGSNPWTIVPAECKKYARIFTLDVVIKTLSDKLKKKH